MDCKGAYFGGERGGLQKRIESTAWGPGVPKNRIQGTMGPFGGLPAGCKKHLARDSKTSGAGFKNIWRGAKTPGCIGPLGRKNSARLQRLFAASRKRSGFSGCAPGNP